MQSANTPEIPTIKRDNFLNWFKDNSAYRKSIKLNDRLNIGANTINFESDYDIDILLFCVRHRVFNLFERPSVKVFPNIVGTFTFDIPAKYDELLTKPFESYPYPISYEPRFDVLNAIRTRSLQIIYENKNPMLCQIAKDFLFKAYYYHISNPSAPIPTAFLDLLRIVIPSFPLPRIPLNTVKPVSAARLYTRYYTKLYKLYDVCVHRILGDHCRDYRSLGAKNPFPPTPLRITFGEIAAPPPPLHIHMPPPSSTGVTTFQGRVSPPAQSTLSTPSTPSTSSTSSTPSTSSVTTFQDRTQSTSSTPSSTNVTTFQGRVFPPPTVPLPTTFVNSYMLKTLVSTSSELDYMSPMQYFETFPEYSSIDEATKELARDYMKNYNTLLNGLNAKFDLYDNEHVFAHDENVIEDYAYVLDNMLLLVNNKEFSELMDKYKIACQSRIGKGKTKDAVVWNLQNRFGICSMSYAVLRLYAALVLNNVDSILGSEFTWDSIQRIFLDGLLRSIRDTKLEITAEGNPTWGDFEVMKNILLLPKYSPIIEFISKCMTHIYYGYTNLGVYSFMSLLLVNLFSHSENAEYVEKLRLNTVRFSDAHAELTDLVTNDVENPILHFLIQPTPMLKPSDTFIINVPEPNIYKIYALTEDRHTTCYAIMNLQKLLHLETKKYAIWYINNSLRFNDSVCFVADSVAEVEERFKDFVRNLEFLTIDDSNKDYYHYKDSGQKLSSKMYGLSMPYSYITRPSLTEKGIKLHIANPVYQGGATNTSLFKILAFVIVALIIVYIIIAVCKNHYRYEINSIIRRKHRDTY